MVIGGDYITTESGTGLVHTAPGHGQDDYLTGLKYGLPLLSPVNDAGRFTDEAGERFAGMDVLGDGNTAIIEALTEAGALIREEAYEHKYPYDWRTKKPTIFRATDQWFASVENFRADCMKAIDTVNWMPAVGKNRISPMIEGRSDWCISRQRSWGVPIPVFYHKETGEALLTEDSINHVRDVVAEHGSDGWWELPIADLLPASHKDQADQWEIGKDTMDVWFDSGSSWNGVAKKWGDGEALGYPADMYLEGSDQHRGWFQSSLLTSVAANGIAPYKTVLTHGFVLDEKGFKMSKSLGNVVDPHEQLDKYSCDSFRFYLAYASPFGADIPFNEGALVQMHNSELADALGNLMHRATNITQKYCEGQVPDVKAEPSFDTLRLIAESSAAYGTYGLQEAVTLVLTAVKDTNKYLTELAPWHIKAKEGEMTEDEAEVKRRVVCRSVLEAMYVVAHFLAPIVPDGAKVIAEIGRAHV